MAGSTNLKNVFSSMKIVCDEIRYGFTSVEDMSEIDASGILGSFNEDEGVTVFASAEYFNSKDIDYEGDFAKLTVNVHTSLELVGLTAALADVLTKRSISANVVAAFYHDHIFVQFDKKEEAIAAIESLSNER
jgi:hypothetical protein